MNTAQKFVNYFKILILCSIAVLTTQLVNKKGDLDVAGTIAGLLMITVVCLVALLISEVKALKKIPFCMGVSFKSDPYHSMVPVK